MVSADQDSDSLRQAWFNVPRMLHERTEVFLECPQGARRENGLSARDSSGDPFPGGICGRRLEKGGPENDAL